MGTFGSAGHRVVATGPGGLHLFVQVHRDRNVVGFAAVLRGLGPTGSVAVVVAEDNIVGTPADRWESRAPGLWFDVNREADLVDGQHYSYGLEAFAIAIDDEQELLGRCLGTRLAFGWELDLYSKEPQTVARLEGLLQVGRGADAEHEVELSATWCEWSEGDKSPPPGTPDRPLLSTANPIPLPTDSGTLWI